MAHHYSKVETPKIYEAEDQRMSKAEQVAADKGKIDFDPYDHTHSLGEKLEAAAHPAKGPHEKKEKSQTIRDPLAPARAHGHEPSRGAQIDAEIQKEEQELLKNKGKGKA